MLSAAAFGILKTVADGLVDQSFDDCPLLRRLCTEDEVVVVEPVIGVGGLAQREVDDVRSGTSMVAIARSIVAATAAL